MTPGLEAHSADKLGAPLVALPGGRVLLRICRRCHTIFHLNTIADYCVLNRPPLDRNWKIYPIHLLLCFSEADVVFSRMGLEIGW